MAAIMKRAAKNTAVLLAAVRFGTLPVFLATSVFTAICDLSFVILQRYNRPRIIKIAAHQVQKKA